MIVSVTFSKYLQRRYSSILALRVTSSNIYLRSYTFYKADTFIFSRVS